MSSITKYESLKNDGTSIDRVKYILSLSDKSEIENHLKQSFKTSYDDLQTLIFLSNLTKNERNLLEIFQTDSLPNRQRVLAGRAWIKLQKDQKQIENFLIQTINNPNLPRYLKHQILKNLHQVQLLKHSPSFFYDLACRLTENNHHEKYNLDAHLVPFCKKDQIMDLLSRWSIKSLKQIDSLSTFYVRLIHIQPNIILHLIEEDLNQLKTTDEKFLNYFQENEKLIGTIADKQAKEFISLLIKYLNRLEKHQRLLPNVVQSKQKYFFEKTPNEMIELMTIVASTKPGSINYQTRWGSEGDLGVFEFPRSFSVENYVRLFFALYDTANWSANHFQSLLHRMLQTENRSLSLIKKRRKWLWDIVVNERIGKEIFLQKLLQTGDADTLDKLQEYPELTSPLSVHLLSKSERNGIVKAGDRLDLLRYQIMTKELFEQFLLLFKQTGSDVNQRQKNYPLVFRCALGTSEQSTQDVLQWIEKRFTNEQLMVLECFIQTISSSNDRFQLEILPKNFQSVETILDLAINHLQSTSNTLQTIVNYGRTLLERVEFYQNKEQKENLQAFALKIIKKCYSKNDNALQSASIPSKSYPRARQMLVDILVSDVLPRLVSKCLVDEVHGFLYSFTAKSKIAPEIDSFLNTFFTQTLPTSIKLQSAFHIDTHSLMIKLFLKNRSTRLERVNYLINQLDKVFFLNENVQRTAVRSEQCRALIDQLIADKKSVTLDKLSTEQSQFAASLSSPTKQIRFPGLDFNVLTTSIQYLTGKQQENLTDLILNDYLQDTEVTNLNKLKSLRVLRRFTHTYHQTLQWIEKKQGSSLTTKNPNETVGRRNRGAAAQPLDDLIICLPSTFDLTPESLRQQLQFLKTKLTAANAKFISDACLSISRKVPDQMFLTNYLEFLRDEEFQKLGITATKEMLRLLIEYRSNSNLIQETIKPFWDSHSHQDVRACLILILLHFIGQTNSVEEENILWKIFEEAADDEYLLIIQHLLAIPGGTSARVLLKLKNSFPLSYEKFVNQIQLKILDHPKSLQARSLAWTQIDHEHVETKTLVDKAQQLCIQFDKNANHLWEAAFGKILSLVKGQRISSIDLIFDIIKNIMTRREEIDSKENAVDHQHDLPVYHRIQRLLTNLNSNIKQFDKERQVQFRSLTPIILQFDKTFSPQMATLLIKISQNKEDLENVLKVLEENLPEDYFQRILSQLATLITNRDSCPFVQQLNVDEKLQLARWFIKEKNRALFVFDLLKTNVFNQAGVDRQTCQELVQQIRSNEDLFVRQQAMEYTVPWKEDGSVESNDEEMSVSEESDDSDMS